MFFLLPNPWYQLPQSLSGMLNRRRIKEVKGEKEQ